MEKFEGDYEIVSKCIGEFDTEISAIVDTGDIIKPIVKKFYVMKVDGKDIYGQYIND